MTLDQQQPTQSGVVPAATANRVYPAVKFELSSGVDFAMRHLQWFECLRWVKAGSGIDARSASHLPPKAAEVCCGAGRRAAL